MRETSTDYQHPFRPPPVAALNRLAAMLGRDEGRLDAHAMVRGAEKATGLSRLRARVRHHAAREAV
jgi:hypothetical protein